MSYYRRSLAQVHARDHTQYALAAARLLLDQLEGEGLIIDLGCGSGDLAGPVREAGFDYLGIDLSADMIALARDKYPHVRFTQGSAFDLPDVRGVRAIAAVGEVVNYATDARAGAAGLTGWLRRCQDVLEPGGLLLLDVAGPLRAAPEPATRVWAGDAYRIEVTVSTDASRRMLRREITVDDERGRTTEIHELHLIEPVEVMAALRAAGFRATALDRYSPELPFPRGWSGFLARVPPRS